MAKEKDTKRPTAAGEQPNKRKPSGSAAKSTGAGAGADKRGKAAARKPGERGAADDRQRRVRDRAYEIWEQEGRPAGREREHWERAERES